MALDRLVKFAKSLKPSDGQPLRKRNGEPVWHGVTGNRFARPLPPESKGPIRAREVYKKKGIDGY